VAGDGAPKQGPPGPAPGRGRPTPPVKALFWLQLAGFLLSVFLLSRWVNRWLTRWPALDPNVLPAVGWGWCAYLVIFWVGRAASAPVELGRGASTAVALGVPALALVLRLRRGTAPARGPGVFPADRGTLLLVGALVAAMLYVGPYLEYPADPVEYLYRVQSWEKARWMDYEGYGPHAHRFAAFAEHWLLRPSGISVGERGGLGVLAAAFEALLFWQFVRLGAVLTGHARWGWVAGVLSLAYFGFYAISFYRYTYLSGPLVSYVLYLEGLVLLVAAFRTEQWRYLLLVPPLAAAAWMNHEQGTLFLLVAASGFAVLLLVFRYRALSPPFRRVLLAATAAAAVIVLTAALLRPPVSPPGPLPTYFTESPGTLFGWKLHHHGLLMLEHAVGLPGWLTLSAGILLLVRSQGSRGLDLAAALAVWPFVLLLAPPSYEILGRFMNLETLHRLLYGAAYWVLPAALVGHAVERLRARGRTGAAGALTVAFVLAAVAGGFVARSPIHGRLDHVFYRPDPRLDGRNLEGLVRYVRGHAERDCVDPYPDPRYRPIRRYVLSDTYVNSYLQATGYFYAASNRRGADGLESPPIGLTVALRDGLEYPEFRAIVRQTAVCYVILYRAAGGPKSWLGAATGHWPADFAQTAREYSPRLVEWVTTRPDDFALVFAEGPVRVYRPRGGAAGGS
jgi:hypothetical protein